MRVDEFVSSLTPGARPMERKKLLSHVDLRVRNREAALTYYDALFAAFGIAPQHGETWIEYAYEHEDSDGPADWIAFTEDKNAVPSSTRIALAAASRAEVDRVAAMLPHFGSRAIEGPEFAYGPRYYAVFFEDPDGNRLEICYIGD
jgi:catechol 2,3-dioxygenase-like lactoylglutathione lyase family enzyme